MIVFTTVFGVLWGVVETILGSYLHLFRVPFTGSVLAAIGAVIMCTERLYTPVFGATLTTGVIAAALKCFSVGTVRLSPAIAIGVEALVAEIILSALGPGRLALFLASLACCLEGMPHVVIAQWLTYGQGIIPAYLKIIGTFQSSLKLGENLWWQALLVWAAVHVAIGIAAGLGAVAVKAYLRRG